MEPNRCYRLLDSIQSDGRNTKTLKSMKGEANETHSTLNNPEILAKPLVSLINPKNAGNTDQEEEENNV
jgi:hypothetical protein